MYVVWEALGSSQSEYVTNMWGLVGNRSVTGTVLIDYQSLPSSGSAIHLPGQHACENHF